MVRRFPVFVLSGYFAVLCTSDNALKLPPITIEIKQAGAFI